MFNFSDSIDLFFFNKTESDIWLREKFDVLRSKDGRFSVTHVLSKAENTWTGQTGRISKELVEQIAQTATFFFVCGPPIFSDIAADYLGEHQVETHFFQG